MAAIKKVDVTLNGKEDWDDWVHAISGTIPTAIWKAICPTNRTATLLEEPAKPNVNQFDKDATSYHELSVNQQQSFHVEIDLWKEDRRAYERQQKDIEEAYTTIFYSVATIYQKRLSRNKPLTDWIDYLRVQAEPSEGFMLNKMKVEYRSLLRQFKGHKNIVAWLEQWETFMVRAAVYNLPELDGGNWLMDISNLMESLHQTYATTFREAARSIAQDRKKLEEKLDELLKLTITLQVNESLSSPSSLTRVNRIVDLSKDISTLRQNFSPIGSGDWNASKVTSLLMDWAKDIKNRPSYGSGSLIQRGAFYTSDNDLSELDEQPEAKNNKRRSYNESSNKSSSPSSNKKRKMSAKDCTVCGYGPHELKDCWILFPSKAPHNYKANPDKVKEVNKKLINNPTLKAKVEQIKKEVKQEKSVSFDDRVTELN